MFTAVKHRLNPARCLDDFEWNGIMLHCTTCNSVACIDWPSGIQVFKRYAKHSNAIKDYIKRCPHKEIVIDSKYDKTWEPVRELIADIASATSDEPLPFEDDPLDDNIEM